MRFSGKSSSGDSCCFLDSGAAFCGELHFEGTCHIRGSAEGVIRTSGALIVEGEGVVRADIRAGEVRIMGNVTGDIACDGVVVVCTGGSLVGDVQASQLIVEDGAAFRGLSTPSNDRLPGEAIRQPLSLTGD